MAISSGVYGLAGVLIGSGVTAGGQWILAARTDRLDARVAKRQVRRELQELKPRLERWVLVPQRGLIWSKDSAIATAKWKEHSDRLARQLSDTDWEAVQAAYLIFGKFLFISRVEQEEGPSEEQEVGPSEEQEVGPSEEAEEAFLNAFRRMAEDALRLTEEAIKRLR